MPPRKRPVPDSLAANPDAARLLQNLITSGTISPSDRASDWKNHPVYAKIFAPIDTEKFRKRFKKLLEEKYPTPRKSKKPVIPTSTDKKFCSDSEGIGHNQEYLGSDEEDIVLDSCELPSVAAKDYLIHKPIFIMPCWRHPRTRDRRVALVFLLPSGILESENEVSAVLEGEASVVLTFCWPTMLLKPLMLADSILSFCSDIDKTEGTLLGQGMMDYLENFQERESDVVTSTYQVKLPFAVKSEFSEDIITFNGSSAALYFIRFCAPESNFTIKQPRITVHKVDPHSSTAASNNLEVSISNLSS